MDYYAEKAKAELEHRKHEAEMLRKAWTNVERVHTKDGADFKALGKNFLNADIKPKGYSLNEREIKVSIADEQNHYFSDSIDIDRTVFNDEEAEQYKDRLIERGQFLRPYYELTPSEIEEAINNRVQYYDHQVAELHSLLLNFDEVAERLVGLRNEAEEYIKAQPSTAYYVLRSIVREERL